MSTSLLHVSSSHHPYKGPLSSSPPTLQTILSCFGLYKLDHRLFLFAFLLFNIFLWDPPICNVLNSLCFSLLYSISFCGYATIYLSILLLMEIWVISALGFLWITLLFTFILNFCWIVTQEWNFCSMHILSYRRHRQTLFWTIGTKLCSQQYIRVLVAPKSHQPVILCVVFCCHVFL